MHSYHSSFVILMCLKYILTKKHSYPIMHTNKGDNTGCVSDDEGTGTYVWEPQMPQQVCDWWDIANWQKSKSQIKTKTAKQNYSASHKQFQIWSSPKTVPRCPQPRHTLCYRITPQEFLRISLSFDYFIQNSSEDDDFQKFENVWLCIINGKWSKYAVIFQFLSQKGRS